MRIKEGKGRTRGTRKREKHDLGERVKSESSRYYLYEFEHARDGCTRVTKFLWNIAYAHRSWATLYRYHRSWSGGVTAVWFRSSNTYNTYRPPSSATKTELHNKVACTYEIIALETLHRTWLNIAREAVVIIFYFLSNIVDTLCKHLQYR